MTLQTRNRTELLNTLFCEITIETLLKRFFLIKKEILNISNSELLALPESRFVWTKQVRAF